MSKGRREKAANVPYMKYLYRTLYPIVRNTRKGHRDGHPSTLARAIGELGRILKTLHMLACVDEAERRRLLIQLNKGESRHSLARRIFHGHKGEVRQRYREGQEERLSALGLVMNAIILWNTLYMDRALEELHSAGMTIPPEDAARLSPIGHEHINVYGKYSFTLAESIRADAFHPLRELEEATEEEPLQEVGEETFGAQ